MITHINLFFIYIISLNKHYIYIVLDEISRSMNFGSKMLKIANTVVPIHLTLSSNTKWLLIALL